MKLFSYRCRCCWARHEELRDTEQYDDPAPVCPVPGCRGELEPWNYPEHKNDTSTWGEHHGNPND